MLYYNPLYWMCRFERISMHEYYDPILHRAFQTYYDINFTATTNKGIYFKEDDEAIGTQAYVAYMKLFQKENIRWNVLLVTPIPRSTSDSLVKGDIMFVMVCIVATIGFSACLGMFFVFYQKRKETAVIQADWSFTCTFILGS
jgi:hypothetical protein